MGRYFTTASGNYCGKFWFGVQPSDDPAIFGLKDVTKEEDGEMPESYIDYEGSNKAKVRRELNKQFDILGVPKQQREYKFDSSSIIAKYVGDRLREFYLTKDKYKAEGVIGWGMPNNETWYPITREKELAASRVELGLCILNEMTTNEDGVCLLNAEL